MLERTDNQGWKHGTHLDSQDWGLPVDLANNNLYVSDWGKDEMK
jgi:hypothetical protein